MKKTSILYNLISYLLISNKQYKYIFAFLCDVRGTTRKVERWSQRMDALIQGKQQNKKLPAATLTFWVTYFQTYVIN